MTTDSDLIWNRAAMDNGGLQPGPGDRALADLLRLHSLSNSGGLLDTVQRLSPDELDAAMAGLRYFGLADAATAVDRVRITLAAPGLDESALEELERTADADYAAAVPLDSVIVEHFESMLASNPTCFQPLLTR